MTVTEDKNGYTCRFQIKGIRKHLKCKGAKTRREANLCEKRYKEALTKEIYKKTFEKELGLDNSVKEKHLINALFKLHINYAEANKLRDIKHIKSHHKFFKKYFEENNIKYVEDIKKSTVDSIKVNLIEKGLKPATVNRYFNALSKMLSLAVDDGILEKNPCSRVKKLTEDNIQLKFWENDEANTVIAIASPILKDMIRTALYTGLRKSNIRLMEKKWVNFNDRTITIPSYANKSKKKLVIQMVDELYEILYRRVNDSKNRTLYVFINAEKEAPVCDDTMRRWLKKTCELAQVKYIGWHGLRHTFATNAIIAGMNPVELKDVLGHSTLQMVERYAHSKNNRIREVMSKMPKFLLVDTKMDIISHEVVQMQ